jgi:hypothetical protein
VDGTRGGGAVEPVAPGNSQVPAYPLGLTVRESRWSVQRAPSGRPR